ncbi:MAG: phospho-sugar mutase [Actinomycetota bacterium]|nr:phospho-sugar mutase [Actinomycetota bacterium]
MRQDGLVRDGSSRLLVEPEAWINADPDPHTRSVIEKLSANSDLLAAHFNTKLSFGTAGLRAERGVGPSRMNRVSVRVAARAIGRYLLNRGLAEKGVVIGYDARPDSDVYALDSARLLTALGVRCWLIDEPCPTPVVVWNQMARSSAGTIVVTASHNPSSDSGYKVYGPDGTQIRPPLDEEIELLMNFDSLPTETDLATSDEVSRLSGQASISAYVQAVIPESDAPPISRDSMEWVYTPLCGVGGVALEAACSRVGISSPIRVDTQFDPDGSFPGLPFPNPEEVGVLAEAFRTADRRNVNLVLANDPDADRLAVAVRTTDGWNQLSGDELGLLLCDHQLNTTTGNDRLTASSVVSSEAVAALCAIHDVEHVRTLTGFKWIMEPAVSRPDRNWIFGYEEALGYSVNDAVLDKDGISAAVKFLEMIEDLKSRHLGPLERLDELALEIGLFVTHQASGQFESMMIQSVLDALRADPPLEVNGSQIATITDWLEKPPPLATNLIEFRSTDGVRIAIRPSGTEPKVKIYLEQTVSKPVGDLAALRSSCSENLQLLGDTALSWFG